MNHHSLKKKPRCYANSANHGSFWGNLSLVPRPSITANVVEGLIKLLHRMMSGRHWVDVGRRGLSRGSTAVHRKCHASQRLPAIILRRSCTRPSTALAVIEGLGTRL